MTEFKKLFGNRVLLDLPKKEEGKLYVDENTKEALEKEMVTKYNKLTVYKTGDIVTSVKAGDVVLVSPEALSKAPIIPMGEDNKLLVSIFDIILLW